MKKIIVFFLFCLPPFNLFLFAQWSGNPAVNNAICTAANTQSSPAITSDGSGGAIITWHDRRSGTNNDIYAKRINSDGVLQWTANGVAICTAVNNQSEPTIASDGNGGAIIAWQDVRGGATYDIYARRINSAGTVQWAADGIAICTAALDQFSPKIISDGSGGAIITWSDFRNAADWNMYAQRINSAGAVQWAANGVALCTAAGTQGYETITSDGNGGAIIGWADGRSGAAMDIYAQRINSAGAVQWAADGAAISTAANTQSFPEITSDGSAGAIITWYDSRAGNWDIYAQRINSAGTVQWTADGVAICTAANTQSAAEIISDGSAGAIITWYDSRAGNWDIYAQRINSVGTVQWTADGVAICTAANTQSAAEIISDGSAGAIITWQDLRGGTTTDIYAQRINAAGTVQWVADGVTVSTAADAQSAPEIVASPACSAIIVWYDNRVVGNLNIYAFGINCEGNPLPVELLFFEAAINDQEEVSLSWATATEMNNDYFAIERAASGSGSMQWEQIGRVKGTGNSSTTVHYEFIDTELPLPAATATATATFYYRLRQVDYNGQYAYSSIRQVTISTPELFSVYPTPSSGDFTISFSEQKGKEILLVIRNILGQEFYSKEFIIDNDLFIESVNLSGKLASGIYTIIAASDNCVFGKKIAIK